MLRPRKHQVPGERGWETSSKPGSRVDPIARFAGLGANHGGRGEHGTAITSLGSDRDPDAGEQGVFRLAELSALPGAHAGALGRALTSEERVECLVHATLRVGGGGPFGIRAAPASTAIAVTDSRFLLARCHSSGLSAPEVLSIPFDTVLWIESGRALVLGWLLIRYVESGAARSITVGYPAVGNDHFSALLRAWRVAALPGGSGDHETSVEATARLHRLTERHREAVMSLLIDSEYLLAVTGWDTVHQRYRTKRGGKACLAPAGALVVSAAGLLLAVDDNQGMCHGANLAVNTLFVPRDALARASLVDRTTSGPWILGLRLVVGRGGTGATIEIPLSGASFGEVRDALYNLPAGQFTEEVPWSS